MRKIYLLSLLMLTVSGVFAQEISKSSAVQLLTKNSIALGFSTRDIENSIVSNAYHNKTSGIDLVYVQQSYKGLPVYNQILSLAFKNGLLISKAGDRIKNIESKSGGIAASATVTAANAVREAMLQKKLTPPASLKTIGSEGNKIVFAKTAGSTTEDISAELMWVPVNNGSSLKLAWQVYLVPSKSSDYWLVRMDAHTNQVIDESNLTVYCKFDHNNNSEHGSGCDVKAAAISTKTGNNINKANGPEIVNGAAYRVIPFPAESPNHPGGAHSLVSDPWTAAPGNATSLKWHSDGSADYNYTRGNNVWAYQDRVTQNTPTVPKSTTSTTGPDPLTFNFTPDYAQSSLLNAPAPNKDFNVTNLFYWNNVIHDVLYQYGFDEVAGNFQANNQGRGGTGNDYVMAEGQDASGSDNANFSTPSDGGRPRMQMYLWNKANKPAFTIVNAPASIAGNFTSVESNFVLGTGFPANNILARVGPVTADVVYYNDNAATTHEACVAAGNTLTGKIVLINRGNCDFLVKVQNAQNAGAVGVVMINNVAGAPIIMGGANASAGITIPAVMVSDGDGAVLVAQVANGLNITLAPDMTDGDVDNGVVVHEFGHGVSNRLTGGPAAATCLQNAEQMGEGWSDYYSLMLTQNWATSNVNTGFTNPRGIGTYDAGQPITGGGIRSQRYCTDFTVNNLVFGATLPAVQHDRGEIWCATLWDMTWNIIQQVNSITPNIYTGTGTGGNVIALRLVTEGMKLQPCSPGFIDGRNAILQADQILYNGAYSCAIKEAFRRRGMGPNATQGSSNSVIDQTADFTAAISVVLTQSAPTVVAGQNITFTNKVTSCSPITGYILRDTLPANVTYVSGGTYDAGTRVVSFPVTMSTGGTQNYSFVVTANSGSYYAPTSYLNETVAAAALPATLTQTSTTATVWTGTTAQSHSAPASVFSPNAATPSDQVLRTANPIALGTNQSALSFWHWYNTEAGYDGGVVEISTDAGTTWNDLDTKMILGYYNATIAADAGTPITGRKAYSGNSSAFIKTDINLSSYAGQSALFRWRFNSDDGTNVVGWYVDDILIKNEAVVNMRSSLFNASNVRIAYSDTVTLIQQASTCNPVTITTQPANTNACVGGTASFTVVAAGTTPAYQWQVSTDGGTIWTDISGATTATLNLTGITAGMNNNRYRAVVSNTCPSTITSTAGILTVLTPTAISSQPSPVTVCAGANASFAISATGTALTYQWQVSTDGGTNWSNVPGAASSTLTLTAVTAAMNNNRYRVLLSDCNPAGVTSNAVILTVNAPVAITTQPVAANACTGGTASFSVVATGSNATYQWEVSTDGGNSWANVPAATSATLNLTGITSGMNNNRYRVIVSNTCPSTVTSNAVILSVITASNITGQPTAVTVCSGQNASFSVTATGTALTYQWQVSTNGGTTWTNISGATASNLSLTAVTAAMNANQYRVILSDCNPAGLASNAVVLTVNAPATIGTQPVAAIACTGGNATFTVAATGTGISYQWQVSTNGGTSWTNIAGATTASFQVTAATAVMNGNLYRVIVSGTACTPASTTSNEVSLTVNNSITITQQPQSVALCSGGNTSFSITAAGSGLTYQWQVSSDGGTSWTNITGATSSVLSLTSVQPSMNNNQYRVVLNGSCASNVNSNAAVLTVNSSVTITTQPANQVGCAPAPATFTVAATGTTLTYQWQVSTNGGTSWTNIAGATSTAYTITALDNTLNNNQYRVIVTGTPCGAVTSAAATLTVGQLPVVTISANPGSIFPGQTAVLSASATPAGTYIYQWFKNNSLLVGETGATLNVGFGDNDIYKVTAFNSNGCSNTSANFSLSFGASNVIFIYPSPNNGIFSVRYFNSSSAAVERVVNVHDAKGALVFSKSYSSAAPYFDMMVDIRRNASGVYIVDLLDRSGNRIGGGKVVKQ